MSCRNSPEAPLAENEFYGKLVHGPYEKFNIGDLVLERGGTLRKCQLACATFGKLNEAKDNVILVPTWFAGTNKIMEQIYIGSGRAHSATSHQCILGAWLYRIRAGVGDGM